MTDWEHNEEIKIFRDYLQIPTVQPDFSLEPCVAFILKQAEKLGLPAEVLRPGGPDKPIVVMTWKGTNPELPAILLNSHMDVVAVFPEKWSHPPFAADMDSEGRIYARGAQDMKSVGMQHLAAIRALKKAGVTLKRTIHVTYVPDEESGGKLGMGTFVHTDYFKKLNIGFSLEEGRPREDDTFAVFYGERSMWRVHLKISGVTGHGSILHENTAGVKLQYLLEKFMEVRERQVELLQNDENLKAGDVMTINLTKISGGVQTNVVPPLITAVFDVRLPLNEDHDEFEKKMRTWCEEAGGGIEIFFELKESRVEPTKIDSSNIFWTAFKGALTQLGLKTTELICPGGTDSRYVRALGIPALGFSPMNFTPLRMHDNNEFLKADTYLKGIEIYKNVITELASA